jgi:hypothetical protein
VISGVSEIKFVFLSYLVGLHILLRVFLTECRFLTKESGMELFGSCDDCAVVGKCDVPQRSS